MLPLQLLTAGHALQARKIFNAWAYEAETTKMYVERCERMLQARDVVTTGNVIYWWHTLTFQVPALSYAIASLRNCSCSLALSL